MKNIEELYKQRISKEIEYMHNLEFYNKAESILPPTLIPGTLASKQHKEERIIELKQEIKNHPQKISKKRELELWLETIEEKIEGELNVLTPAPCTNCNHNLDLYGKDTKQNGCAKGHFKSYSEVKEGDKEITFCQDYDTEEIFLYAHDCVLDQMQQRIKELRELKQQKQTELEQYKETQEQIRLERRLE